MPCFHPLKAYKSQRVNPETGKRSVTFNVREGYVDLPVSIACGRCTGCRLERSRQWAIRCVHEAQLHQDNAFITLTYDNDHLPYGGTLIKKHFQDFMKRLRRKYDGRKISYFHCGEYGETSRRPHYHALVFGLRFLDQAPFKKGAAGSMVYTSEELSHLWPWGFSTVGEVTFESAAYVARYVMKKVTGEPAEAHYTVTVPETGEVIRLLSEYITMSLKPAIGKGWFEEFSNDVYPDDFVVVRGKPMKPPKYYDRLHELADPAAHADIKEERANYALQHKKDATPERLAVRETCKNAQIANLKRTTE